MIESNLLPPERRCSNFNCFGPPTELRPVTMWYRDADIEKMYREQPDPHFRYDLVCAFIMFISLALLQLIVVKGFDYRQFICALSNPFYIFLV